MRALPIVIALGIGAAVAAIVALSAPPAIRPWMLAFVVLIFAGTIGFERLRRRRWLALASALHLEPAGKSGFGDLPPLRGSLAGRPVTLRTFTRGSGKNQTRWTALDVDAPRVDPYFRLRLTPEGLGTRVAKAFGGQDVQLGDEAFDEAFRIESNDADRALRVFDTLTREMLLRARKGEWEVANARVAHHRKGLVTDPREAQALAELAARVASAAEAGARVAT